MPFTNVYLTRIDYLLNIDEQYLQANSGFELAYNCTTLSVVYAKVRFITNFNPKYPLKG